MVALAIAGLVFGFAAAVGVLPTSPPQFMAPVLAILVGGIAVMKVALAGGAALDMVLSKD